MSRIKLQNKFFSILKNYIIDTFSIDLRALGILRIGLGIAIVYILCVLVQDITMLYTDEGIYPRSMLINYYSYRPYNLMFSLYLLSGEKIVVIGLFIVQFISAFCVILGYKSRFNIVLSWLLLMSLQNRNMEMTSGFDLYLKYLLFWSMFLPLHAKYSIDALTSVNKSIHFENKFFSPVTICLFIQICLVYFFSALLKFNNFVWWPDLNSLIYILNYDMYLTNIGYMLKGAFPDWFLRFGAFMVLMIEIMTPFMLLLPFKRTPVRIFWFIVLFLLHAAFRLFLFIGPFIFVSTLGLLVLLPSVVWDKLEEITSKKFGYLLTKYHNIRNYLLKFSLKKPLKLHVPKILYFFNAYVLFVVLFINFTSYKAEYRDQYPLLRDSAYVLGLDQYFGYFVFYGDNIVTVITKYYAVDNNNKERLILPIKKHEYDDTDIRAYVNSMSNVPWRLYLSRAVYPDQNTSMDKPWRLIRALCLKENRDTNKSKTEKILLKYTLLAHDNVLAGNRDSFRLANTYTYEQKC